MSPSEYAARIERELAGGALFGWGIPAAGAHGLVAYLTARIDGASAEWSQDGHLYVCDVDVQADQRGRGHLRRLLACARADAKARGLDRIELSWIANDPRAEAVWTRLGFRPFVRWIPRHLRTLVRRALPRAVCAATVFRLDAARGACRTSSGLIRHR